MVLKRKLPSQLAKESANDAPQSAGNTPDNATPTTDFVAEPTPSPKDSAPANQTDQFTADALKEAASALAAEMGDTAPKSDLYLEDPFEDLEDSKPRASQKSAGISAEEPPFKDTFADVAAEVAPAVKAEPELTEQLTEQLEQVADSIADIDEKVEPKVEPETETAAPETKTPDTAESEPGAQSEASETAPVAAASTLPTSLKRKNRNKRKRAAVATADGNQETSRPTGAAEKAQSDAVDKQSDMAKPNNMAKPNDMELAAEHKPDADRTKSNVDRAFIEMAGVPDPAEQEIEAAYMPPAEVEPEAVYSAPKRDVSMLLADTTAAAETPKDETKTDDTASTSELEPDVSSEIAALAVPPSFAEQTAPSAAEPEASVEEARATDTKQEDAPIVAPVTFAEPQSFADIAAEDKNNAALPWEADASKAQEQDGNAWELDVPPTAPTDVYSDVPASEAVDQKEASDSKVSGVSAILSKLQGDNTKESSDKPIDAGSKKDGVLPPPELPTSAPIKAKSFNAKPLLVLVALGVVGFAGYKIFTNQDEAQERVARFTGALDNTPERLPPEMGGNTTNPAQTANLVQPEQVITQDELARLNQELEEDLARLNNTGDGVLNPPESRAQIDFVDVTAEEANQPIVAAADAPLPGEKGFVASLQDAINQERQKRGLATAPAEADPTDADAPPEERRFESADLQAQVQAELEAYRQALAGGGDVAIKPTDFFGTVDERGVLLPPTQRAPAGAPGLPESEIFTDNPYNLPVLAEPVAEPELPTVRSLNDFDVAMFEPPKPKVRIPQGLKPRLRASDFPEVTVLSLVPNKGMIAHANGREGVLLIGEMIEGWELFAVTGNHAEFRSGQRKYYVNLD